MSVKMSVKMNFSIAQVAANVMYNTRDVSHPMNMIKIEHGRCYWPNAPKIDACWIEHEHGDARLSAMLYITLYTFVQ